MMWPRSYLTQSKVVAIQQEENPKQISAFMGFGLITTMAHTHPTTILTTLSINPRDQFLIRKVLKLFSILLYIKLIN